MVQPRKNAVRKNGGNTPIIRTGRGKLRLPIFGGIAIAQSLDRTTAKKIKDDNTVINEDGSTTVDNLKMGYDSFKESLAGIEGYKDEDGNELKCDDEFKENILNFNPEFFIEFTNKSSAGFARREDVVTKN